MRVRTGARIPNREDVGAFRRPVATKPVTPAPLPAVRAAVPVPAAPKRVSMSSRERQRFCEQTVPVVVEAVAEEFRKKCGVALSARARASVGTLVLATILDKTSA